MAARHQALGQRQQLSLAAAQATLVGEQQDLQPRCSSSRSLASLSRS
jgi:hypothetical protein